jgi:histone H3/H4
VARKHYEMPKRTKLSYGDYRPIRKGEVGYSKTKRTYVSPSTGKHIPVAKFQKLAKGETPSKSRATQPTKPNTKYTQYISKFVDKQNKNLAENNLNPNYTRGEARTNPQFKRAYANLRREGKKKSVNRSAHGTLAEALEDLGIRDEGVDYPVGDTPD